jgi:hypothetical protein
MGYTGYFVPTNAGLTSACQNHGNAIFTLGATPSATWSQLTPQADPAEPDVRKALCVKSSTVAGVRTTCTAHITNRTDPKNVREDQDNSFEFIAASRAAGLPLVATGDRNLTTDALNWPSPPYIEFDNGTIGRGTYQSFAPFAQRLKLDWIFASASNHTGASGSNVSCSLGGISSTPGRYLSDHCVTSTNYGV